MIVYHLVGSLKASQRCLADHDRQLHLEVTQDISHQWGEPWFDLFTTAQNTVSTLLRVRVPKKALSEKDSA